MYFKDKLDSINAYICISVHTVSGNIARIAAMLQETNLHAKSSIAATLQQYCQKQLRQYCKKLICMRNPVLPQRCGNIAPILPETVAAILLHYCRNIAAIYCQKACFLIRVLIILENQYQ